MHFKLQMSENINLRGVNSRKKRNCLGQSGKMGLSNGMKLHKQTGIWHRREGFLSHASSYTELSDPPQRAHGEHSAGLWDR